MLYYIMLCQYIIYHVTLYIVLCCVILSEPCRSLMYIVPKLFYPVTGSVIYFCIVYPIAGPVIIYFCIVYPIAGPVIIYFCIVYPIAGPVIIYFCMVYPIAGPVMLDEFVEFYQKSCMETQPDD